VEPPTNQAPEPDASSSARYIALGLIAVVGIAAIFLGARTVAGLVSGGDSWSVLAGELPGSSATAIYETMQDAGVVRSSDLQAAARAAGVEDRLQAGTYALVTDMDPADVVRRLIEGGDVQSGVTFTVIEGWTINRIVEELASATGIDEAAYRTALSNGSVTSPLLPDGVTDPVVRWEGLLFPAKYLMAEDATPTETLQMMATEMTRRFEEVDWAGIGDLGISRYEALVIGSLIEWEAGTDSDRPIISSVIHNRLDQPMRLQIDATVIYALGYNPGRVLAEDLKIESPYNTYLIDGLPPTPIGTVSAASLQAAVNPSQTEFLFYVLGNADGTHVFATTYEQHQANVRAAKESGILP